MVQMDWCFENGLILPSQARANVLVRVFAAGVNPVDWKNSHGELRPILWIGFATYSKQNNDDGV